MYRNQAALAALAALALPPAAVAQHRHGGHSHRHGYLSHVGHGHVFHGGHGHVGHHYGHHHHGHYGYGGYYSPSYPSYGYARYGYATSQYPIVAVATQPAYPVAAANVTSARLQVQVPDADAQVWLEGTATASRGMTRVYESPSLEEGKTYTYKIRATWNAAGRNVTEERQVGVTAGRISVVDFSQPPDAEMIPPPSKAGIVPPSP